MKLNRSIFIDFLEFCKTGKFDYIELGKDTDWILNNFPEPDSMSDMGNDAQIWLYGNIEFHFFDNQIYMIFSDHFTDETLHGGKNLMIKPWIFTKKKISLKNALKEFNLQHIDYQKVTTELNIEVRLSSGMTLYFENTKGIENLDPNQYRLIAFAFQHNRH